MVSNYIKIAFRNIVRHRGYSFITIMGLALGMACALVIFLYTAYELGYDRNPANSDRIYRVTGEYRGRDGLTESASIKAYPPMQSTLPEVESTVRIFSYSWKEKTLVSAGDRQFYEEKFLLADPSIFEMFSISLLKGDRASALGDNTGIAISQSMARKYFGGEDPLGKVLSVKNLSPADFVVTNVFGDLPANSHFHCDFIAPLSSGRTLFWEGFLERNNFYTYILLRKGASPGELERKFPAYLDGTADGDHPSSRSYSLRLQPLVDIHLTSHCADEIEPTSDVRYLYLLSVIALIILVSACVNFVNLTTARSERRAKEVGLRKVLGAYRVQLIRQFLAESFLLAFVSLPPALVLAGLILPAFNVIMNSDLRFGLISAPLLAAGALVVTLFCGLVSGSYPAFLLSAIEPARILKGGQPSRPGRSLTRSSLVIVQCGISLVLIVGTLVVYRQMRYVAEENPGFRRDQLVIIYLKDTETVQGYPLLKTALGGNPDVLGITASAYLPSDIRRTQGALYEGSSDPEGKEVFWNAVDYDFLQTFGIGLAEGRNFSEDFPSDGKYAYIVNETAVKAFGWKNPLGRRFGLSNSGLMRPVFEMGEIIGVVKDFHFQSLHTKIEPLVLKILNDDIRYVTLRIRGGRTAEALGAIGSEWKRIYPGRPFEYFFFDETMDKMYRAELRTGAVFLYASLLSVIIAGLGLYGLASFSVASRTKEIGIRKTIGASAGDIVVLVMKDYGVLFLIANVLSWPVAYLLMSRWLEGFAYRITLGPGVLLLASALSLLVLLTSVGSQSLRAARANPVESLRYE